MSGESWRKKQGMNWSDSTCTSQRGEESSFSKAVVWRKELLIPHQTDPDSNKIPEGAAEPAYLESSGPSTGSGIRS